MSVNDELIRSTMTQAFAKEIIEKLPKDYQTSLLTKALAESLHDYKVKSTLCKAANEVVNEKMQEFLKTEKAQKLIEKRIQEGFDELMSKIPKAVEQCFKEILFGKKGDHYSEKRGMILNFLDMEN